MKTHFGLGAAAILAIDYDYAGPHGVQRKVVTTREMVYVYHARGGAWVIVENQPAC